MRLLIAFFVFFLALGLSIKSTAEEAETSAIIDDGTCTGASATLDESCTPETKEKKPEAENKPAETAIVPVDEYYGHYDDKWTKMNSLFPQPQKNRNFTRLPAQAKLVSPAFLSTITELTTKLEWTVASGAQSYHLQVATDPNFKWQVVNKQWIKENSFTLTDLVPGKRYYWRVASVNDLNNSMYTKSAFTSSVFDIANKK